MIVCVDLATRNTIYAVPRHVAADDRVVAPDGVVAGDLDGVEVVRMPGFMVESTILVGDPVPALRLDEVALYVATEATDDGHGAPLTVVTRGANGCVAFAGGETIEVAPFPVDAVSTLGAGDVFHGALLACLVRGLPPRNSLVRANACAALSCRALDGRSAIPTWDEPERAVA